MCIRSMIGIPLLVCASAASADVLVTFDVLDDGGSDGIGPYAANVSLAIAGIDGMYEMNDGQVYDVSLNVEYSSAYDSFGIPMSYTSLAVAAVIFLDPAHDFFDLEISFAAGGFNVPYSGTSALMLSDVTPIYDNEGEVAYWSYGLPIWETTDASTGESTFFMIDYGSLTETIIPAPGAIALVGLVCVIGRSRRRTA